MAYVAWIRNAGVTVSLEHALYRLPAMALDDFTLIEQAQQQAAADKVAQSGSSGSDSPYKDDSAPRGRGR